MIYNWTQLGIKEITNLYLYGTPTTPNDLTDDAIIRPDSLTTPIQVYTGSFMADGPGRFALGSLSALVQTFFSSGTDLSWMQPGINYTKNQFINGLVSHGVVLPSYFGIDIKQVLLNDLAGDYWQRAYIWNSGRFKLDDNANFVVDTDGNRHIENYAIVPDEQFQENFDFTGDGLLADLYNDNFKPVIDPSGIGGTVDINFVGEVPTRSYTFSDYQADLFNHGVHLGLGSASIATGVAGALAITNELWVSGVLQTIYQGKPILYSTDNSDTLSAAQLNDLALLSPLRIYGTSDPFKGVALIASGGNDILNGGFNADYLKAGDGDDTLTGNKGNDTLEGGTGNDTYIYNSGDGFRQCRR
jgi:Ca2+-binding RTX toxin-like protein